jgi:phosphoribosyl-ATP pyrophosphohydrolase
MKELYDFVEELHKRDAIHIKRGFRLSEASDVVNANHLLEEAVELQAEVISGNKKAILEESADVLACFLHLLVRQGINIDELCSITKTKLEKVFSFDENDILTSTPGLTRKNRKG